MNKREFEILVDALLDKARAIPFDDYSAGMSVLREWEGLVLQYGEHLNPYVLEHSGQPESEFNSMRKAKKHNDKVKYWSEAIRHLEMDISSMKIQNNFPE